MPVQLILEKISLAAGGLLLMVGAGCHIAKEVGWMVSKGARPALDVLHGRPSMCISDVPWRPGMSTGIMCPPTRSDWKSYTFWMNWATFWVRTLPPCTLLSAPSTGWTKGRRQLYMY